MANDVPPTKCIDYDATAGDVDGNDDDEVFGSKGKWNVSFFVIKTK